MTPHTAADYVDAYEAQHGQLKRSGGDWKGPCPLCGGHDRFHVRDGDGRGLLHCRHGCTFRDLAAALIPAEAPLRLVDVRERSQIPAKAVDPAEGYGCSLSQLAAKTMLPVAFLRSLDWTDAECFVSSEVGRVPSVRMPYAGRDGKPTTVKHRVRVSGGDKYRFEPDQGARLFGEVELLGKSKKLVIVEGETDAATLWHHELPAVGVPGTSACSVIQREHLDGVERVYVVAEQDEAGAKFPAAVQARLRDLGLSQPVLAVHLEAKDTNELHRADPTAFPARFKHACRRARGLRKSTIPAADFATMREVMRTTYPPTEWVVKGLLPEGLALLASSPKVGKSALAYQLAAGVSQGKVAGGIWQCEQGEVLYLDLEQKLGRRTQERAAVVGGADDRDAWHVIDHWPRLDEGGLTELDVWLEEHPGCRLVVIDVISRVMPVALKGNVYHAEYQVFSALKRLGDERGVCVLIVHHDNKTKDGDLMNAISGSRAITGASNAILWLTRAMGETEGKLQVMGRDVEEAELSGEFTDRAWRFAAAIGSPEWLAS